MPAATAEPPRPATPAVTVRRIVFYDGVCALCNRAVRFLLARDRRGVFHFAPLQGETFRDLTETAAAPDDLSSIVYVRGYDTATPTMHVRSDAFCWIMRDLGGIWRIVSWVRAVPRAVRDAIYDWVARNRYKWFGRYDRCRIPSAPEQARMMP